MTVLCLHLLILCVSLLHLLIMGYIFLFLLMLGNFLLAPDVVGAGYFSFLHIFLSSLWRFSQITWKEFDHFEACF